MRYDSMNADARNQTTVLFIWEVPIELRHYLDEGLKESKHFSWEHSRQLIRILDRVREETGICYPDEIEKV